MNNNMKDLHILVMFALAFIGIILVVISNIGMLWVNLFAALCWLFSFTLRNLFIYKVDKYRRYALLTYGIEIAVMFLISLAGAGSSVKVLLYLTVADCYIAWSAGYGTICAFSAYILFITPILVQSPKDMKSILVIFIRETPGFILVAVISYLMGRVLRGSALIEKSMKEAEMREVQLKAAYQELSRAYDGLEEMAALQERNRIAREIHDTVGHTITTVIVELEAGRMLKGKDSERASEKFLMAYNQAVKALEELRRSVRLLASEEEKYNLRQAILQVIEETEQHAGVAIRSIIEVNEEIQPAAGSLLVRILKEGLSNGIRHGGGTAFFLRIVEEGETLSFLLQDNGKGCSSINPGFGLDNMKKSILKLGGDIEFNSELGEGFEIKFMIPFKKVG